ncbi:MAG TPA: nuclear transport factor 2 family protein [Thermoanaerobaculia bacterium]
MGNKETAQEIYEAFGRGDVAAILERLDEDVEWEYGVASEVPWLQPRRGRTGAAEFFASLGELEIHTFILKAILEGDGLVVALIDVEATVKATGKRYVEEDEVHIWYFNEDGKVVRFRHRVDTQQHYQAWRG